MKKKRIILKKGKTGNPDRTKLIIFGLLLIVLSQGCRNSAWQPLFNGKTLPPFHHYLGRPDPSVDVPGLKRDSAGNYLESPGWSDPLNVFSVTMLDGEPVIRISGQIIGGLVLADSLSNYELKLKFKWGEKKWEWMEGRPKDGGILYHQGNGVRHEFQIHEGDVGSYWSRKTIVDIPSRWSHDIPEAIKTAKPYLEPLVSTLNDSMLIFDMEGSYHHFNGDGGPKDWQIVIAHPYNENPPGEWNTLELICWNNHAVHMVNGKVNLVVLNSFSNQSGKPMPVISGRLVLQSEGAELYFKDIKVKQLSKIPEVLRKYLK